MLNPLWLLFSIVVWFKKLLLQPASHEILFRFEYTAITKIILNRATLVKFHSNYSLSFVGTVNLALANTEFEDSKQKKLANKKKKKIRVFC